MNGGSVTSSASSRTFTDKVLEAWYTSRETLWIGVLAGTGFQLLLTIFSPWRPFFSSWPLWAGVTLLEFLLLLTRRRFPLCSLTGVSVILALGDTPSGTGTYSWLPFLICLGSVILRDRSRNVLAGLGIAFGAAYLSIVGIQPPRVAHIDVLMPTFFALLATTLAAVFARGRVRSLDERDQRLAAEDRERKAIEKQRKAESVSRVATNLHDSVGHNLTGIITLVEGISHRTGNKEVDDVIDLVNELARDALAETRSAIRAITVAHTEKARLPGPYEDARTWNDVARLIHNVRTTGVRIAVTESGERVEDPVVQDVVYRLIREGLTNVMQHAQSATVVVISLVFTDHAVEVTLTDNGEQDGSKAAPGVGLGGLADLVERHGGEFSAGSTQNGWKLRAVLPRERGGDQHA